jgi:hypothetical protein
MTAEEGERERERERGGGGGSRMVGGSTGGSKKKVFELLHSKCTSHIHLYMYYMSFLVQMLTSTE